MSIHRFTAFSGVAASVLWVAACVPSNAWAASYADLAPTTPPGWSAPIVVSTYTGTNVDSPNNPKYTTGDTLYADIAVVNQGTLASGDFYVRLFVDGAAPAGGDGVYRVPGLLPGQVWTQEDISLGKLSLGASHSIRMTIDPQGVDAPPNPPYLPLSVLESNPNNNEYSRNLNVQAPNIQILSGNQSQGQAGTAWSYQIETSVPATNYSVQFLTPDCNWILLNDIGQGTLNGQLSMLDVGPLSKIYTIVVFATNGTNTTSKQVTITMIPVAPIINSSLIWYGRLGQPIAPYTITYDNSPSNILATPLPNAGIDIVGAVISGTPQQSGDMQITLDVWNTGGRDIQFLHLIIVGPPVITSELHAVGIHNPPPNGVPFSYQVTASEMNAGGIFNWYDVAPDSLPPGLTINNSTGVINGTPTAAGTWVLPLYVSNENGSGTATLTIGIADGVKPAIYSPLTVHAYSEINNYYAIDATPPPDGNTSWYVGEPQSAVRPLRLTSKAFGAALAISSVPAGLVTSAVVLGSATATSTATLDFTALPIQQVPVAGNTVTINDGTKAVVFEFVPKGGTAAAGHVSVELGPQVVMNDPARVGDPLGLDATLANLVVAINTNLDIDSLGGFLRWRTVPVGAPPPYGATHLRHEIFTPVGPVGAPPFDPTAVALAVVPGAPRTVSICDVPTIGPIRTNQTGELIIAGDKSLVAFSAKATYLDVNNVEQSVTKNIFVYFDNEVPHIISSKLGCHGNATSGSAGIPPGAASTGNTGGGGQGLTSTMPGTFWAGITDPFGVRAPFPASPVSIDLMGAVVIPPGLGHASTGVYWSRIDAWLITPPDPGGLFEESDEIDPFPYIPACINDGEIMHDKGLPTQHVHQPPNVQCTTSTLYCGRLLPSAGSSAPIQWSSDGPGAGITAVRMWTDGSTLRNDGLTGMPNPDAGTHTARWMNLMGGTFFGLTYNPLNGTVYIFDPTATQTQAGTYYVEVCVHDPHSGLDGWGVLTIRMEHIGPGQPIITGPLTWIGQIGQPFNFVIGATNGGIIDTVYSPPVWIVGPPPGVALNDPLAPTGYAGTVPLSSLGDHGIPGVAGPYTVTFEWFNPIGYANSFPAPSTVVRQKFTMQMVFYDLTDRLVPRLNSRIGKNNQDISYGTEKIPLEYKAVFTQNATTISVVPSAPFTFPPPGVVTYPLGGGAGPNYGILPVGLRMDPNTTASSHNLIEGIPPKGSAEYYPGEVMMPKDNWVLVQATHGVGPTRKTGYGIVDISIYPATPAIQPDMDFAARWGFDVASHISPTFSDIVSFPINVIPVDHPEFVMTGGVGQGYYPRVPNGRVDSNLGSPAQGYLIQAPRSGGGKITTAPAGFFPNPSLPIVPGLGPEMGDSKDQDGYWNRYVYAPYESNWGAFYYGYNLPSGMTTPAYLGTNAGLIYGTLQYPGHTQANVRSKNSYGSDARTVIMGAFPVEITSPMADFGYVGSSYNYVITATGAPFKYSASGLPPGLSIDTNSGLIYGVPLMPSDELNPFGDPLLPVRHFDITITASNAKSTGMRSLDLTVVQDRNIPLIVDPLKAPNRTPFLAVGFDGQPFYSVWQPTRLFANGARNPASGTTVTFYDKVGAVALATFEFTIGVPSWPNIKVNIGADPNASLANLAAAIPANMGVNWTALMPEPGDTIMITYNGAANDYEIRTSSPAVLAVSGLTGAAPARGIITTVRDGPYYPPPPGLVITAKASGPGSSIMTSSPLLIIVETMTGGVAPALATGSIGFATRNPMVGDVVSIGATTFEFVAGGAPTVPGAIAISMLQADGTASPPDITLDRLRLAINANVATVAATLDSAPGYRVTVASNAPDVVDPLKPLFLPTSYSFNPRTPLPPGLSLDDKTGIIKGTPIGYGEFDVHIIVANVWGQSGAVLHISIKPVAPTVTSESTAVGIVRLPFSTVNGAYTFVATGSNGITYAVSGNSPNPLPPGLTLSGATISGTPTQMGPLSPDGRSTLPQDVWFTVANAGGSVQFILDIFIYQRPQISSQLAANGIIGSAFTYTFTASGSPDNLTFILGGSLPPGINQQPFPNNNVLMGIPEVPGDYLVPVFAQNITGALYVPESKVNLAIHIDPMVITSPLLCVGTVGVPLNPPYVITSTGTPTSYTADGLPQGLFVDPAGGAISGTPLEAGSFPVYIEASNAVGKAWAWVTFAIQAGDGTPAITSPLVATGVVNSRQPFTYQIEATNNPTSFDAVVKDPNFPALTLADLGLHISHGPTPNDPGGINGMISGTPLIPGTFMIEIFAANGVGTGKAMLTLAISASPGAPAITSTLTALAMQGVPFSYRMTASNGPTSYGATENGGSLPDALRLVDPVNGLIQGVPSLSAVTTGLPPGIHHILLSATNTTGTGSATLVLTVLAAAPPTITSGGSVTASVGTFYPALYLIQADFAIAYGATGLPVNLSLSNNVITGTPWLAGVYNCAVSASNANGMATKPLTITVNPRPGAPVVVGGAVAGQTGLPFTYQIQANGNPSSYMALPTGASLSLPPGLSLDPQSGVISGVPTDFGTWQIIIGAQNGNGWGTALLTINIVSAIPAVSFNSVPVGNVGVDYPSPNGGGFQLTSTGVQPFTWSATQLPPGLLLVGSMIVGTPTMHGIFPVDITATNGYGSETVRVYFNIGPPLSPVITSPLNVKTFPGIPFNYTITATGSRPMTFGAANLPPGLSVNSTTGVISGAILAGGSYLVTLTADNSAIGGGTDTKSLVIEVIALVPGLDSDGDGFPDELEIFLGTDPLNYSSTPFNNHATDPEPFHMPQPKLAIKLNFAKPNADSITVGGTLPVQQGFTAPGQTMVVDIGGVMTKATLDRRGSFVSADKRVNMKLQAKGKRTAQNAKYTVKLKGNFQTEMARAGLINANVVKELRSINVYILLMDVQVMYNKTQMVLYSAKAGKSGSAK